MYQTDGKKSYNSVLIKRPKACSISISFNKVLEKAKGIFLKKLKDDLNMDFEV